MEDDLDNSSSVPLLPLALAVLAILLGGAGLYFGLSASQRLSPLTETLEAGSSSSALLEKEIAALATKVSELSAQNAELKSALDRVRLYSNQSEQAVKGVATAVSDNRAEIVKLANRMNEMVKPAPRTAAPESTARPAVESPAPAPAAAAAAAAAAADAPTEAAGTYTISSGDTFAKIAAKLGVSLQALLDANPDTDPRRLAIGQMIKVPAN